MANAYDTDPAIRFAHENDCTISNPFHSDAGWDDFEITAAREDLDRINALADQIESIVRNTVSESAAQAFRDYFHDFKGYELSDLEDHLKEAGAL